MPTIVALAIGVGLLHETFSWRLAAGAGVIVVGVAVTMLAREGWKRFRVRSALKSKML